MYVITQTRFMIAFKNVVPDLIMNADNFFLDFMCQDISFDD